MRAELQTTEREIGDSLTSDELMALGREVGIPGRYLQQALLEERSPVGPGGRRPACWRKWPTGADHGAAGGDRESPTQSSRTCSAGSKETSCSVLQRAAGGRILEPLAEFRGHPPFPTPALGSGKRPFMLSRAATVQPP